MMFWLLIVILDVGVQLPAAKFSTNLVEALQNLVDCRPFTRVLGTHIGGETSHEFKIFLYEVQVKGSLSF